MALPNEARRHGAIPEGGFRFRLGTRPAEAAEYFRTTADNRTILKERRHWLQTDPDRYVAILPEGVALLDETIELAAKWNTLDTRQIESIREPSTPLGRCTALGREWEPDFALLRPDSSGQFILVAGCVCFPSHWRLPEKMGRSISAIHEPVPGLNDAIGPAIDTFLLRMKPGTCWTRSNWNLSRTCELNQYPERNVTRVPADCTANDVWLRMEHQALVSLPATGGVLFGIRLEHVPFTALHQFPALVQRLRTAIETIPEDMLRYKCSGVPRDRLLSLLVR
jgi:dimethylamine monooxygenase subunit A